ncbi:hypothetical protein, partial [Porphyromonas levii]
DNNQRRVISPQTPKPKVAHRQGGLAPLLSSGRLTKTALLSHLIELVRHLEGSWVFVIFALAGSLLSYLSS